MRSTVNVNIVVMDAPEKIWINPSEDLQKLSGHIDANSVKYTRTDALIEKADEFIGSFFHPDDTELRNCLLKKFHEYMEGE